MDMSNDIIREKMAKLFSEDISAATTSDDYRQSQTFDSSVDNLTLIYGPSRDPL